MLNFRFSFFTAPYTFNSLFIKLNFFNPWEVKKKVHTTKNNDNNSTHPILLIFFEPIFRRPGNTHAHTYECIFYRITMMGS